eukprot:COSAG01_NODE_13_length_41723_cov_145.394556_52_plen_72_part_00
MQLIVVPICIHDIIFAVTELASNSSVASRSKAELAAAHWTLAAALVPLFQARSVKLVTTASYLQLSDTGLV